ncbi:tetratricopeptide repeat protein [Paraglaciecola marina]|uniref:tetratricopeptide repeat protein n=1 Tax=Paraglaciecola marina TaxID=2500157 RepID=UPI0014151B20|nr:tetratricopeptide repeat protein [Paraglaciecola marina]
MYKTYNLMIKNLTVCAVLWTSLSSSVFATTDFTADITVNLAAPKWEFLLKNIATGETQAQLASSESSFAKELQPLLAAQDHKAIEQAFSQRDIEQDSAALRQLRGQVLISLKQYSEAEVALKSAIELMPDLALAHRSLSMVYMVNKDYQKAQTHLKKSIELGVADAQVYGQLAFVNLQLKQGASAIAGYQYALFLDPDNLQWKQGLLYALINAQAFSQAQALLEGMLMTAPDDADLWLQRSQLALRQGHALQALSSLESAVLLNENAANANETENIVTLAQLHIQSGSAQRAVELLDSNIALFLSKKSGQLGFEVQPIDQICQWLVFNERWQPLEQLLTALAPYRKHTSSYFTSRFDVYSSKLALHKGDTKRAEKSLMSSVKADPANGEALLTIAKLMHNKKRSVQAVQYYVRAQALTDFRERALLGQAQLEIDRQQYSDALRLLRQVIQLNPARQDVLANIQSLTNLVRHQS